MNATMLDKKATLNRLANLGAETDNTLVNDLATAHKLIKARKGVQKATLGGESVKDLRSALDAASRALADCPPGDSSHADVYKGWKACHDKLTERADSQEGLEYHYLETFRDAVRAVLGTRGIAVSLKGDGTVSVKRA